MSSYARVKKYRDLKRKRVVLSTSDEDSDNAIKKAARTKINVISNPELDESAGTSDAACDNSACKNTPPNFKNSIEIQNNLDRSNERDSSASLVISSNELDVSNQQSNTLILSSSDKTSDKSNETDSSVSPVNISHELDISSQQSDTTILSSSDNTYIDEPNNFDNIGAEADTLKTKLQKFALRNISTLNHKVLSEVLLLFRSQGFVNLPKTAATLLRTCEYKSDVRPMLSGSGNYGEFVYFGIEKGLKQIISPKTYSESEIKLLINVDGLPIYRHSRKQFWPILAQLYNSKYESRPFVVALYCGDSKPHSVNEFFDQFVADTNMILADGITIGGKQFTISIAAFVCDTPARSFIKCSKGHGGFYACERCEVKGKTVNHKRVYGGINSAERTSESFRNKNQTEHHLQGCTSPLLDIPGLDPVRSVVIDKMHLFAGIAKSLLEKWLHGGNNIRISRQSCLLLSDLLRSMTLDIPMEFQRKRFDLKDLANWKATQFGFILMYCGGLILRHVLPNDLYRHFLLLFVFCRILCHSQLAVVHADYAKRLLRQFVFLMPIFYGADSQVMNFHNLIHVADDVKLMNAPLTDFSAFPFENCLGMIKKLIRTPQNPLAQVARRLYELQAGPQEEPAVRRGPFTDYIRKREKLEIGRISEIRRARTEFFQISLKGISIRTSHPDNIVQLKNGTIIRIKTIFASSNDRFSLNNIFVEGYELTKRGDAFEYPCLSSHVGIVRVAAGSLQKLQIYRADIVSRKCITLKFNHRSFAITMLH